MRRRRGGTAMIHGGAPAGWLELSASLNPLGTPAEVVSAIAAASYGRYADLDAADAEEHLAREAGVPASCVLLTAGATEAIRLVAEAFARSRRAVVVGPTYSEYARVGAGVGASVREARAVAPSFDPPVGEAIAAAREDAAIVFVCDPNNPTGRALDAAAIQALAFAPGRRSLLVLDASFAAFAEPTYEAREVIDGGRVVLVRSLTKRLATPGVRVGYVVASPEVVGPLRAARDPWTVGAHAVAAARAARWMLSAEERATVARWRDRLARGLAARGLVPVESDANFVLAHTVHASALVAELGRRRVALRDCSSFGLPDHVRVAVRPPQEQDVLFAAMSEIGAAVA
ncbi:MAG: aminotransferase class I/II-fold pyridoxal phosphate-dependent enzyme [Chloroflexota bacterium]|nr:aminotransferase class I/II-fold pyridoxal phosphate-dependent enzyme [Chloroflexota bacterium]